MTAVAPVRLATRSLMRQPLDCKSLHEKQLSRAVPAQRAFAPASSSL